MISFPYILFLRRCLTLILIIAFSAEAQQAITYSERAEKLFADGLVYFSDQKFGRAVQLFGRVIHDYPLNRKTTAAWIMLGKAEFELGETKRAEETLTEFISLYPASSYRADAHYTLGLLYTADRRYDEAVTQYRLTWRTQVADAILDGKLRRNTINGMDYVLDRHASKRSIERLLAESVTNEERAFFLLKLGERELTDGNVEAAAAAVDTVLRKYPDNQFQYRVENLRKRILSPRSLKIGALLPLVSPSESPQAKEVGNAILDGIRFAVEEFEKEIGRRGFIKLEIRDTEGDSHVASRLLNELADDREVIGVIGPVFSDMMAALAPVANNRFIPMVSPTANANDLAGRGLYTFQASPDYETRGRGMARFCFQDLGSRLAAVLAPSEGHGKHMADAFIAEMTRLGGEVVATEWYQPGTKDLTTQLSNIRRAAFRRADEPYISFDGRLVQKDIAKLAQLGVPLKTLDSLIARRSIVSISTLLGPDAKAKVRGAGISTIGSPSHIDSLEYPVPAVQALYLPIGSPEDIGVLSSQIVYYNFRGHLLGSGEWNSLRDLDANNRYTDGVIFESDFFVSMDEPAYVDFVERFHVHFRRPPSKFHLYGYDCARLLLTLIQSGATDREQLRNRLEKVEDFPGIRSRIGFSGQRVNPWLHILRFSSNAIKKIADVNIQSHSAKETHGGDF